LRRNKSSHIALAIYAIVSKFPPAKFMELVGYVSQIIGPINLLLVIVTGSVRGKEHVDQPAAAAPGVDRISVARAGAAPVTQTDNFWQVLFFVIGGIVLIVISAGQLAAILSRPRGVTSLPPPNMSSESKAQSNGPSKSTNDYLRQLSKELPPGTSFGGQTPNHGLTPQPAR
jgi:hypothetical protein